MKQIFLSIVFILLLLGLSACHTTRTALKESTETKIKEETFQERKTQASVLQNAWSQTDVSEGVNIVIQFEETEYYDNNQDSVADSESADVPGKERYVPPNVKKTRKGTIVINGTRDTTQNDSSEIKTEYQEEEKLQQEKGTKERNNTEQKKETVKFPFYLKALAAFLIVAFVCGSIIIIRKRRQ
jgi:hypothetical protein